MEKKWSSLDKKINKLVLTQIIKLNTNAQFYPRVVNKTNIPFTNEELKLLNKSLKYTAFGMWWHTVTHGRGSEWETGEWSG